MADLSNRALALLLVVAIVVSISGTLVSLNMGGVGTPTGYAIDNSTGTATFTISSNFSITFGQNTLLFGTGAVTGGGPCTMNTTSGPLNDANCENFNNSIANANLTIINDGNIRANVSLNFSQNATGLIGGTSPQLYYEVSQNESSSCAQLMNGSSWETVEWGPGQEVNVSGARICNNLNYVDATDSLELGIALEIPENAATGARTLTIIALGCDDNSC